VHVREANGYKAAMATRDLDDKTLGQWLALTLGVAFTLAGIAGFFVTGFDDFANNSDKTLLGLEVNPLHNILHLTLGLLGLAMWRRRDTTRTYGWLTFAGYTVLFFYGLAASGNDSPNLLSLNAADNAFHFVVAVAGVATALLADRRTAGATTGSNTGARTTSAR
jgi:hypothetical protein